MKPPQSRKTGAVAFTTTHWSIVLAVQGATPTAQGALDNLCRTYWPPIYAFVPRQGMELEVPGDIEDALRHLILGLRA